MKLKKLNISKRIMAGLVSAVMLTGALQIPAFAAATPQKLLITPPTAASTFYIDLTATLAVNGTVDWVAGDTIVLPNAYPGQTATISNTAGSYAAAQVRIESASLNGVNMTSDGRGVVSVGANIFGARDNVLSPGKVASFIYKATLSVPNAPGKNPVTDLGLSLTAPNSFTFTPLGEATPLSCLITSRTLGLSNERGAFQTFSATVRSVANSAAFKTDTQYNLATDTNIGSLGFTIAQQSALDFGKDFSVTVSLKEPLRTITSFSLYTDLAKNSPFPTYGNTGDTTIVFKNVPQIYFTDVSVLNFINGAYIPHGFKTLLIAGGGRLDYSSVSIDYTVDTAGTATPATPSTPSTPATPVPGDQPEVLAEDELSINYSNLTLNTGASIYLTASESVSWSKQKTGGDSIRVFTSGKITGVKAGKATVIGRNKSGDTVSCVVTVINSTKPAATFSLKSKSGTVYVGSTYALGSYTATPSATTDKVSYSSSNPYVATVNSKGAVTVNNVGSVTITATTSSGLESRCKLTAKQPTIVVNTPAASIRAGEQLPLSVTVKPTSARLTYESLNESIAVVNSAGVITGLSRGPARIQISTSSGTVKVYTVTVS